MTAQGIDTRSAIDAKRRGPKGESPVGNADAPRHRSSPREVGMTQMLKPCPRCQRISELLACSVTGGVHFAVEPEYSSVDVTFRKRDQAGEMSGILTDLHPLDEEGCFIHRAELPPRASSIPEPEAASCTMGVGCDEAGVCYATAHGEPERCPKAEAASSDEERSRLASAAAQQPGYHVKTTSGYFPRRAVFEHLTPLERQIKRAMLAVENSGAHRLLTDAVVQLEHAGRALADWVDLGEPGASSNRLSAVTLPPDIAEAVVRMGKVEWGAVGPKTDAEHVSDFADSLQITREHFSLEDDRSLHGLYLEGTATVLCHTGTSPNSAVNARALAGAWNWLLDQCASLTKAGGGQ
jgi:hypothetical protein